MLRKVFGLSIIKYLEIILKHLWYVKIAKSNSLISFQSINIKSTLYMNYFEMLFYKMTTFYQSFYYARILKILLKVQRINSSIIKKHVSYIFLIENEILYYMEYITHF